MVLVAAASGGGEKCGRTGTFNSVLPVRAGTTVVDSTVEVLVVTVVPVEKELQHVVVVIDKEIVVPDVVLVAAASGGGEKCGWTGTFNSVLRPRAGTTVVDSTVEVLVVTVVSVETELHVVVVDNEIVAVDVVLVAAAVEETATMVIVDFCSVQTNIIKNNIIK